MPQDHLTADSFSRDILDFLLLLHKQEVRYLIIGGEAVIFHGYARLTGQRAGYCCSKGIASGWVGRSVWSAPEPD